MSWSCRPKNFILRSRNPKNSKPPKSMMNNAFYTPCRLSGNEIISIIDQENYLHGNKLRLHNLDNFIEFPKYEDLEYKFLLDNNIISSMRKKCEDIKKDIISKNKDIDSYGFYRIINPQEYLKNIYLEAVKNYDGVYKDIFNILLVEYIFIEKLIFDFGISSKRYENINPINFLFEKMIIFTYHNIREGAEKYNSYNILLGYERECNETFKEYNYLKKRSKDLIKETIKSIDNKILKLGLGKMDMLEKKVAYLEDKLNMLTQLLGDKPLNIIDLESL